MTGKKKTDKKETDFCDMMVKESPFVFIKHIALRTITVQALPYKPIVIVNLFEEDSKHPGDFQRARVISMAFEDEVIDHIQESIRNYRSEKKEAME